MNAPTVPQRPEPSAPPSPAAGARGTAGSSTAPGGRRERTDPFRWIVEHPGVLDGIVFGGIALFLLLLVPLSASSSRIEIWLLFSIPMFAAGAFLRTRTGWATLAIAVLALLHFLAGQLLLVGDVMIFYALFCATVHGSVRTRRLALAGAFLGAFLQALAFGAAVVQVERTVDRLLVALLTFCGAFFVGSITVLGTWAIGRYQHARVEQLDLARDRAEQAEREREQRAALAVADERARIAREMHDVVAHSLSVIISQADGGRFVASQNPEAAIGVLETIGATGRSALADMRGLLGVLRQEGGDQDTSFGPQPDLTALPVLLERVRAAGLEIRDEIDPDLGDLVPALGLSMFRLVQEALTNIMKHAGPGASALVRVRRREGELAIDIIDDGRGVDPASDGQGHGLTGMRERAALYGGTVSAGPLPAGGFRVRARVPLPDAPRGPAPALAPAPGRTPGAPAGGPGPGASSRIPDPYRTAPVPPARSTAP